MLADTYVITERTIKEPPVSFFKKLKFLGPGFILSASIVGSGELIATTTLGARAGFIAFWIIPCQLPGESGGATGVWQKSHTHGANSHAVI